MAAALRSAPSASPPSSPVIVVVAVVEIPFRPLTDEVLEEEFGTKDGIAFAQARIRLAMSMEDMFGFLAEFPSTDVPDI